MENKSTSTESAQNVDTTLDISSEKFLEILNNKLSEWMETAIAMLPNMVLALAVVVIFFALGSILHRTFHKVFTKVFQSGAIADLLAMIAKIAVVIVGFFFAMDLLGLQKAVFSLLAGAGIIGLALGFAFQDLAENLLAGLMLGIRKPFHPGDLIESKDQFGFVQRLNLRNTIIKDFEGQIIYIPNKEVFKNVLENYSQSGSRRIDLEIAVSYGEDLEAVEKVLREAVEAFDWRLQEKAVEVWALEFGDYAIQFSVRYWIAYPHGDVGYFDAIHRGVKAIKKALDENDIPIPFPIRTLDFGIKGGRPLDETLRKFQPDSDCQDA